MVVAAKRSTEATHVLKCFSVLVFEEASFECGAPAEPAHLCQFRFAGTDQLVVKLLFFFACFTWVSGLRGSVSILDVSSFFLLGQIP